MTRLKESRAQELLKRDRARLTRLLAELEQTPVRAVPIRGIGLGLEPSVTPEQLPTPNTRSPSD